MPTASVHEAKTHLSRLIQRAAAGEETVITRRGKPVARLVPVDATRTFTPGQYANEIEVAEDFDAPLPDAVLDDFEGRA